MECAVGNGYNMGKQSEIYYGGIVYNYPCIRKRVDELMAIFRQLGLTAGDLVGIYFDKSPDMITTLLALFEMKICFLPINLKIPKHRLEHIILNSEIKLIITRKQLMKTIAQLTQHHSIALISTESNSKNSTLIDETIKHPNYGDNVAYVMYTSGSTGKPKGVLVKRSSVLNLFNGLQEELALTCDDMFLGLTNYTFDVSIIELLFPFHIGANLYLAEENTVLNAEKIKKILKKHPITILQATPISLNLLVAAGWKNTTPLLKVLAGGEVLTKKLAKLLNAKLGNVWNLYGPTETTMWSSIYHIVDLDKSSNSIPIGRALKNQQLYVLDDSLNEVSKRKIGELYIGGEGVAEGYINNTELTQERFIECPLRGRIYKTGDIVKVLADGNLQYIYRIDNQVKINGARVELEEITYMLETFPLVQNAFVIVEKISESQQQIIAFVELSEPFDENLTNTPMVTVDRSHLAREGNVCDQGMLNKVQGLKPSHIVDFGYDENNQLANLFSTDGKRYKAINIMDFNPDLLQKEHIELMKKSDCMIMSSITQYFSSGQCFYSVLEKLIENSKAGGTIILEGVRHKDLLDWLLVNRSLKDSTETSLFLKSREHELLISPKFFFSLKKIFSRISYVDINIKFGTQQEEYDFYRYDVYLHIDKPVEIKKAKREKWSDICDDIDAWIEQTLVDISQPIIVNEIPNPVLLEFSQTESSGCRELADKLLAIDELSCASFSDSEVKAALSFLNRVIATHLDVYIEYEMTDVRKKLKMKIYPSSPKLIRDLTSSEIIEEDETIYSFIREPYKPESFEQVVKEIKKQLSEQVLDHLQPVEYYWIEKWPATTNAKIDRNRLVDEYVRRRKQEENKKSVTEQIYDFLGEMLGGETAFDLNSNLIQHGLQSAQLLKLQYIIETNFKISYPLHNFFTHKTLSDLINDVENQIVGVEHSQDKKDNNVQDFLRQARQKQRRKKSMGVKSYGLNRE